MTSTETFLGPLTVVELGSRVAVSATGELLAQLGATVIVIEPPHPMSDGKWFNRAVTMAGKKSAVAERPDVELLIASADVVLLSTDVDSEDLALWQMASHNPIVCDITAFGHSGPLAGRALSEGLVEAMCGVIETTGSSDDPPVPIGTSLLDAHAALYAAGAIIAALRMRRLHGVRERIDVALFDVGTTALINFLPLFLLGKPSTRSGNRHPLYTPWGTYEAANGTLLLCAVTDQQWKVVCEVIGRSELVSDPRFATSPARLENFEVLDVFVQDWVSTRKVEDCEKLLSERGLASGRIIKTSELESDVNIRHRESLRRLSDPSDGSDRLIAASPIRGVPVSGRSAASIPSRGENNDLARQYKAPTRRDGISAAPAAARSYAAARPYSGVRIVEIGQYTVAPLASRIMGALGADVIKVESPSGDAIRKAAPLRDDGAAYIFAISNTDKRGIVLDLRDEADRKTLNLMLETADVLVENLKPGSLANLGFGSAALRMHHPHLICCSVSGFGIDSAYPGRPALDTVIQAMSGLMDITRPNGHPTKTGISASDNLGGQFAFVSLTAALELRDRTGIAVHFDLSMQDATLWSTRFEWNGFRSDRPTIMKAADGHVAADSETVSAVALESLPRSEIVAALPANAAVPVLSVSEVLTHPQTRARELLVECPTPEGDCWVVFSLPFKMQSTPTNVTRVMGRLGGTDAEVRSEIGAALKRRATGQ